MHSLTSAPPRQADPHPVHPFAALPHNIAGRSDLTPTDLAVLLALLFWARSRSVCWPSDASIGARIGRSEATIQRRLRHLESLGVIRREKTDRNRTGRIIRLCWREAGAEALDGARPATPPAQRPPTPSPVTAPPRSPMRDEGRSSREGDEDRRKIGETTRHEAGPGAPELARIAHEPPPAGGPPASSTVGIVAPMLPEGPRLDGPSPSTPPAPSWGPARRPGRRPRPSLTVDDLARLAPSDPILARELARRTAARPEPPPPPPRSTAELIARLGECPSYPPMLAQLLALDLADPGSFPGFHAVAQRAYRGEIGLDALADAYRQGMNPGARNRGAVFMHAIKRIAARSGHPH